MEKFLEYIYEAERKIRNADHFIYMTFPLINDKRLFLKILSELNASILNCINSILQYEYIKKNIALTKDSQANFNIFVEKCSKKYLISKEEIKLIIELIKIVDSHKKSPFEFIKNNKMVILSEGLNPLTITIEKLKVFLLLSKNILKKAKEEIFHH